MNYSDGYLRLIYAMSHVAIHADFFLGFKSKLFIRLNYNERQRTKYASRLEVVVEVSEWWCMNENEANMLYFEI